MAVKIDENKERKSEIEDNQVNHEKEQNIENISPESRESDISYFKVIFLDIIFPLFDVIVDIFKGLLLLFQYESFSSFYRFEAHFNENGIYGLVAISLKWVPAIVAALHFQDINRYGKTNGNKKYYLIFQKKNQDISNTCHSHQIQSKQI